MKRWLVALLVLLALVVLVSPGIIGKLAEQNMEESIQWAENESPGVNIKTESFDRGWFTSVGRHRVVLEGGQFEDAVRKYADATGNPTLPSLVIDTRMDHGIVPISSLSRDAGSLAPGLASTISTFLLDPGDGETVELPGTLYSDVSLGGASTSRLLLEAGEFSNDGGSASWDGADLAIYNNRSTGEFSVHGVIEPVSILSSDGGMSIGTTEIAFDQVLTEYGFYVGPARMVANNFTVTNGPVQINIGSFGFESNSDLEDGHLNNSASITVDGIAIPGFGDASMAIDPSVNRLDAESLAAITLSLKDAQASSGADLNDWETLFPLIEGDLQTLLSSGLEVRFDRLDFSLPQGDVTTRIVIDIPEKDADEAFSWPGVILAMTASVDLRLPAALYDLATMMNPQAGALLAMGILEKDGDDYVMEARYAAGLITINGAPMPIPIPGM